MTLPVRTPALRRPALHLAVAGALVLAIVPAPAANAAPKVYANCTAINKVYSGGIAKKGITKNKTSSGSRALKGKVKFDTALYTANKKSDRDKDGIACEKS